MPFKRIFTSKLVLVVEAIIIIFFAFNVAKEIIRRRALAAEVRKLTADISQLEKNKSELATLLDYVKTDAWVEAEARSKLNLAKDGEKLVLVPAIDGSAASDTPADEPARPASLAGSADSARRQPLAIASKSNLVRWWDYFFEHERLWQE